MAGKISELQIAQPLQGDEFVELIQKDAAGTYKNRRAAVSELKGLKGEEGLSAYQIAVENGFQGTPAEWLASLKGVDGKSAFEVAQEAGFEGSPEDWLATLRGEQGKSAYEVAQEHGFEGSFEDWVESMRGPQGVEGQSAYQAAVVYGFEGTEEEWLASLKGERGFSAYEQAVDNGFEGSIEEWIESLRGADGRSAFEIAQAYGFEGTEEEWLESLKGTTGAGLKILGSFANTNYLPMLGNQPGDAYIVNYVMWVWDSTRWSPVGQVGPTGKSAYQIAVEMGFQGSQRDWLESLKGEDAYKIAVSQGFEGTKSQWLASLKGNAGKSAYQIAVDNGFTGTQAEWLATLVGPQGPQGPQGVQGDPANAIVVMGEVETESALPTGASAGTAYFIGRHLWVWTGVRWFDAGEIMGPQGNPGEKGEKGETGNEGKSAYQLAVENGYQGSVSDWLDSLRGPGGLSAYEVARLEGFEGTQAEWLASLKGGNGLSAYEVAVARGFTGSEDDWLESLVGEPGIEGPQGPVGKGLKLDGVAASVDDLPATAEPGAAYLVERHLYVFDAAQGWEDAGEIRGPSVYDQAVAEGYQGTFVEWLETQRGPQGHEGKSAYEVAVTNGFTGSEAEWLASLVGPQGNAGTQLPVMGVRESQDDLPADAQDGHGYVVGEHLYVMVNGVWTDMGVIRGPAGYSAYELAQQGGFEGTLNEWLASLKGDVGPEGKSAYELAVERGFVGSEAQWLASLRGEIGPAGKSAYALAVENGFEGTVEEWLESLKGELIPLLDFKANLESVEELPTEAVRNEAYIVQGHVWAYIGEPLAWTDLGPISGLKGEKGDIGPDGKTAYELAVENGFEGTITEWLASLKGERGFSAYEIFKQQFPDSTLNELRWLESLNGNRWIVMEGEPNALTGNVGDYYFDKIDQQYYQKISETQWVSMGYIGGGNVYDAPRDGEQYVRRDGEWTKLVAEVEEAPADGKQYVRIDREWSVLRAEVEEVPKPVLPDPENPDIEPTNPDQEYVRKYQAWVPVRSGTPEQVREGVDDTARMTPKAMKELFASMGITYDATLGEWINDEGVLE